MAHFVDELDMQPSFLQRLGAAFDHMIENSSRARQLDHYTSMSDEQLKEIGLRREDIVRHVFRDRLHI